MQSEIRLKSERLKYFADRLFAQNRLIGVVEPTLVDASDRRFCEKVFAQLLSEAGFGFLTVRDHVAKLDWIGARESRCQGGTKVHMSIHSQLRTAVLTT